MEAVGYARISTEDQSTNSLPGQVAEITSFCDRNKLKLHKVFVDNGQSAFNFQRKEWKDLETYLDDHKEVKYLVVANMDRFSRANLVDALQKMDEIQKRVKVKILTVSDPVNIDTEDFGVELRRIMELMFSNYELKKIRKRTADGIYQSLASGRFVNKAPFGYTNGREVNGKPIILVDEEKAFLIRMIFRLYLSGMEMEEIRGHTKAHGFRMRGNSAIRRILSNSIYAGLIDLPAHGHNKPQMVKGIHQALISENDYWMAAEKLSGSTIFRQRREDVFLRGVLHCSCGRKLTAGNSKGKRKYYWYYLCKDHKENLGAQKLHLQFLEILDLLSLPPEFIDAVAHDLRAAINTKISSKSGDLMRAKLSLAKIQDRISSTQEKFLLQPDISQTVYKKVMNELKADEQRLHAQIAQFSTTGQRYHSIMDELLPKLSNLREIFVGWPLYKQQAFINLVFDHSLYYRDGCYRTPYLAKLFSHNILTLKEKGLLVIEQSKVFPGQTPGRSVNGSWVEPLMELYQIFAA